MLEGQNNKFMDNLLIGVKLRTVQKEYGTLLNWAALADFASPNNYFSIDFMEISGNVG
jgi:hypothetical protein